MLKKILTNYSTDDLRLFSQLIYEYKKGIRNLILTTENASFLEIIKMRLCEEKIDFIVQYFSKDKINVFFGSKECIDIVKTFVNKKLNNLTAEQDFILGIMLGYDSLAQCRRYLEHSAIKLSS